MLCETKKFFTLANKKRDMFVVLYFNWHDDIIHKAMASEANTKWRGGVGGKSKKWLKRKIHLCRQSSKP